MEDLVDRITVLLYGGEVSDTHRSSNNISRLDVARAIDQTYRKMLHTWAIDSGCGRICASNGDTFVPGGEIVPHRIRCPCHIQLRSDTMIQCADPQCQVWQHTSCVIIPEVSPEELSPAPSKFFCETCRISRSDPFWKAIRQPLYPVKLLTSNMWMTWNGSHHLHLVETRFQITSMDLQTATYDMQVCCILLNDRVPFRLQWPEGLMLRVNGFFVNMNDGRGANGRDDAVSISPYIREGSNELSFTCFDARKFCLGVRLVERLTVQQVASLIHEQEGESFVDAVARVRRCMGGGKDAADESSDSDLEIITDTVTISLRCPVGGFRMKTAARFKGCLHLGCFDLDTFVEFYRITRKWQCPICLKNSSLEELFVDPYLDLIVKMSRPPWDPNVNLKAKFRQTSENSPPHELQTMLCHSSIFDTKCQVRWLKKISRHIVEGSNKISSTCFNARGFPLGVRFLERPTVQKDLMDRITALLFGGEASDAHSPSIKILIARVDVARVIDDPYRKMLHTWAIDSGCGRICASNGDSIVPGGEIVLHRIRCPCHIQLRSDTMIQECVTASPVEVTSLAPQLKDVVIFMKGRRNTFDYENARSVVSSYLALPHNSKLSYNDRLKCCLDAIAKIQLYPLSNPHLHAKLTNLENRLQHLADVSGSRMKTAARFRGCLHLGRCELDTFV